MQTHLTRRFLAIALSIVAVLGIPSTRTLAESEEPIPYVEEQTSEDTEAASTEAPSEAPTPSEAPAIDPAIANLPVAPKSEGDINNVQLSEEERTEVWASASERLASMERAEGLDFVQSCEQELAAWPTGVSQGNDSKYWQVWQVQGTWCSEFVGYNLWNAGLEPGVTMPLIPFESHEYYTFFAWHPELAEFHINDGTYTPRRGDIVLFDGFVHTEMVSEVLRGGTSWIGVSGGTSLSRTHQSIDNKSCAYFVSIKWNEIGVANPVETRVPMSNVIVESVGDQAWTGSEVRPSPVLRYGVDTLEEGTDYTLSYEDNVDPGMATITIEGQGDYYGTTSLNFQIRDASAQPKLSYATYLRDADWQDVVGAGAVSGSDDGEASVECWRVWLVDAPYSGGIQYRSYAQGNGWEENWVSDGSESGSTEDGRRVEAIQMRLTGQMAEEYDVYYRVCAEELGWMGWASNEEVAGTMDQSRRIEAIQVVLVAKGQSRPTPTCGGVHQSVVEACQRG